MALSFSGGATAFLPAPGAGDDASGPIRTGGRLRRRRIVGGRPTEEHGHGRDAAAERHGGRGQIRSTSGCARLEARRHIESLQLRTVYRRPAPNVFREPMWTSGMWRHLAELNFR
jgi:hypothetical protein